MLNWTQTSAPTQCRSVKRTEHPHMLGGLGFACSVREGMEVVRGISFNPPHPRFANYNMENVCQSSAVAPMEEAVTSHGCDTVGANAECGWHSYNVVGHGAQTARTRMQTPSCCLTQLSAFHTACLSSSKEVPSLSGDSAALTALQSPIRSRHHSLSL